ncbi:MAG: tetratricopeptide repeat protein [Flavobacterium sp.]|nr:tetratricopeptide repeat protein [Flavobacterium sp.]
MNKTLLSTIIVFIFSFNSNAQSYIDSLKTALANEKNEFKKAKILNDLSWEIAPTDYDLSIDYANQALELVEKKDAKLSAEAYTCLGSANDFHGKYDLAISNYQKSYEGYKTINDQTGMAKVYLNIGASY